MPYQMAWIVPRRVLLTTFSGMISGTELQRFIAEIRSEVSKGQAPVYHISNSLAMEKVEVSLKSLGDMIKTVPVFSSLGMQIDVNHARGLNAFLAKFSAQIVRIEAHTVSTVDEAIALLKRVDGTLSEAVWEVPTDELILT